MKRRAGAVDAIDAVLDRRLQIFRSVVRHGSFTGAAKALSMTQPGVSFRIKQLEAHFKSRLFVRNRRHVTLTAAGEIVCHYVNRILDVHTEMLLRVAATTDEVEGLLLIGASATAAESILPRILPDFVRAYPQVRPRVIVDDSRAVERQVAERGLDLGFVEEAARQRALAGECCWQEELVAIASPALPLARLAEVSAPALAAYPFVARETGAEIRRLTDTYLAACGVAPAQPEVFMEMGSPTAVNSLVETGAGIAIATRASVAAALRLGDLVAIPLQPRLFLKLWLVQPKQPPRSATAALFAAFAVSRLRSLAKSAPSAAAPSRHASAPRLALVA